MKKALFFGLSTLIASSICQASLINSTLETQGDAVVGATFLNFLCDQTGAGTCSTGYGDFSIGAGSSTGSFTQYNGTFGQILDLTNTTAPLNTTVSITDFMFFNTAGNSTTGNITFTLTLLPLGTDPTSTTCAGLTHCTPTNAALVTSNNPLGLSAFDLDQTGSSTTAAFEALGTVTDTKGDSASFTALFSSTFAGQTPAQVLANSISTNGTTPVESYAESATITVTPEPATTFLIGTGLLGLGLLTRKRLRRS